MRVPLKDVQMGTVDVVNPHRARIGTDLSQLVLENPQDICIEGVIEIEERPLGRRQVHSAAGHDLHGGMFGKGRAGNFGDLCVQLDADDPVAIALAQPPVDYPPLAAPHVHQDVRLLQGIFLEQPGYDEIKTAGRGIGPQMAVAAPDHTAEPSAVAQVAERIEPFPKAQQIVVENHHG